MASEARACRAVIFAAADDDRRFGCSVEVDAGGLRQPRAEPIGCRARVDEAQLWRVLEILHLNGHDWTDEGALSRKLQELEPQSGAAPSASASVAGTLNIP